MIYEHFKHDITTKKGNDMKYLFLLFLAATMALMPNQNKYD
jgi:hypothetical protein